MRTHEAEGGTEQHARHPHGAFVACRAPQTSLDGAGRNVPVDGKSNVDSRSFVTEQSNNYDATPDMRHQVMTDVYEETDSNQLLGHE